MNHKITIVIESEKEWDAICALSSLLKIPLSKIAKDDLLHNTKLGAEAVKEDQALIAELSDGKHSQNVKKLLAILK